ncbi:clotting factor G beta subunit-like [Portunus trituberculatus]|uniref:clotting factor G beta subunit-like n=1 Tax=Portunus trituberculatus TaxID=210409 RepID=UPI001E1D1722|nr:clotting factor G beta subunit-like [Portunus trituberculatus]
MEGSLILSLCFLGLVFTAATGASRIVFPVSVTLKEGDTCTLHSGEPGRCVDIRHCDYTDVNFRQNQPVRCGFNGIFPIVCCPTTSGKGPQPITDIAPPKVEFDCTKNEINFHLTVKKPIGFSTLGYRPQGAAGSVEAKKHAWPWMAIVGKRQGNNIKWVCGGALINEHWVLTAFHCQFEGPDVVRLGEHDHQDTNDGAIHQDFGVAETVMYPGYTYPEGYHDLALFRLSSRTHIQDNIIPVCLPWGVESEVNITGHTATLTGYGDTTFGGLPTTFLQQVNVTVFLSSKCDTSYSTLPSYSTDWPRGIGEETLCAGDLEGGKDACQGDSGGPLVTRDFRGRFVLAGIVMQGNGCGNKDFPGLYVNMRYPPYLAWVKNVAF